MAHINIKPAERSRIYETSDQAINHMFVFGVSANAWDFGGMPFGRTMEERSAINDAIKSRNFSAFKASRRKGYWCIQMTPT